MTGNATFPPDVAAIDAASAERLVMDEAALERLRIAVRVLNSHHFHSEKATDAEIEILKSYLGRDCSNGTVEEIAAAVIRRELQLRTEPSGC